MLGSLFENVFMDVWVVSDQVSKFEPYVSCVSYILYLATQFICQKSKVPST